MLPPSGYITMFEKNKQVITLVDPVLCAIEVVYMDYLIKSSQEQYVVDIINYPHSTDGETETYRR